MIVFLLDFSHYPILIFIREHAIFNIYLEFIILFTQLFPTIFFPSQSNFQLTPKNAKIFLNSTQP